MKYYTAKELVEALQRQGDEEMTLRKVRYYTQINLFSPLEIVNGKSKYTERHLEELRTIRTLKKTGINLEEIRRNIKEMDMDSLLGVSYQSNYVSSERLLETVLECIDDEVSITFNKSILFEKKSEMVRALQEISEKYKGEL